MPSLDDFFKFDVPATRLLGTYLYPMRYFGGLDVTDPYALTEIFHHIRVSKAGSHHYEVLLTRNAGLFLEPPGELPTTMDITSDQFTETEREKAFQKNLLFQDLAANIFNQVICEFTLAGIVSEPTSSVHISVGKLVDNHAVITSAGGGREFYRERTLLPVTELFTPMGMMHIGYYNPEVVDQVVPLERTTKLLAVSEYLPVLVASAYSRFSQGQIHGALSDSWIVIEQILNHHWLSYVATLSDTARQNRLKDYRVYTASVRTETLYVEGVFSEELYRLLNLARTHRNNLLHNAKIDYEQTHESMYAMYLMLNFHLRTDVAYPVMARGTNW